jgi:hypothetical protein
MVQMMHPSSIQEGTAIRGAIYVVRIQARGCWRCWTDVTIGAADICEREMTARCNSCICASARWCKNTHLWSFSASQARVSSCPDWAMPLDCTYGWKRNDVLLLLGAVPVVPVEGLLGPWLCEGVCRLHLVDMLRAVGISSSPAFSLLPCQNASRRAICMARGGGLDVLIV